jgi:hypothetical protein
VKSTISSERVMKYTANARAAADDTRQKRNIHRLHLTMFCSLSEIPRFVVERVLASWLLLASLGLFEDHTLAPDRWFTSQEASLQEESPPWPLPLSLNAMVQFFYFEEYWRIEV